MPYRRIESETLRDEKVARLSRPPPNGQTLWFYLLAGERTTIFPGLVVAREAVIASDHRWTLEGFRGAWKEIADKGMAIADWEAGVVLLPRALLDRRGKPRETARPSSPNAFRGWAKAWSSVPDCELKAWYLAELGRFAAALDPISSSRRRRAPEDGAYCLAFEEAFGAALERARDTFCDAFAKPSPTHLGRVEDVQYPYLNASATHPMTSPRPTRVPETETETEVSGNGSGSPDRVFDLDPVPSSPPSDRPIEREHAPVEPVRRAGREFPPAYAPPAPGAEMRRALVMEFMRRVNAGREKLAAALKIQVRPIAITGLGERELIERLKEAADPAADLDHVIRVAELEAKASGELKWFGWSLAGPKAWRIRLAAPLPRRREDRDHRPPVPPPGAAPAAAQLTADDMAEMTALSKLIASNPALAIAKLEGS